EQTTVLRYLHAHLLQEEEDWEGAAKVLMNIPLEGGTRLVGDEEKLSVYMTIVRLLLECGEWGQAQTYFTRASMLIHLTTDKTTQLSYRLAQARIFDFSARFNEAAQRYHELSFDKDIDEGERMQMLRAAVITSILAPSGPQRSRSLTTLNRDDRLPSLTPALTVMLRKMLLESIVRPSELHTFEDLLEPHQRAIVEGGGTVLERAVREHNVAACAKLYSNISFVRLGEILGYNDSIDFIETMVRRMIEQGRLRGWMDQPRHLVYFEDREEDEEGKQVAGGLGVISDEQGVEPVSWTERWDGRIR
ncbi:hypothetical protein TREMEDRAFT_17489, partial [Tremella mesenterica DSM 1558]|uniref:uncharacterized protein n=1 Tax=Tremella mesenterica (strain ATCC 24925 / CBS 8224 / DSM 1558 / NBRC 9311 / NRRL Y-6157 / RJB 2259-6 / UBC 559-6) TaxID=578456 RepID=UPI00032C184F